MDFVHPTAAGRHITALALALAVTLTSCSAWADNWSLRIASWNLLNLGLRKAGLNPVANKNNLLDKYADTIAQYDIVFLQEILDNGTPVTVAIAGRPQLANYNCQTLSVLSGRAGRQERYSICYTTVGGRLTLNATSDYMAGGGPYGAFNGTNQPAQNVWMRPPLYASFTYRPPPGRGAPFTFGVFTNHTKPSFGAQARPPGIPAGAGQNTSVYYELWGIEHNLQNPVPAYLVIGDLNADCASYPVAYRNQNFVAPFYSWYINYGEKTNTAPLSSCAYDRIIFNPVLDTVYLQHGIFTQGIAAPRLDNERVSDHYLVWVEIGRDDQKYLLISSTAVALPVTTAKRQRRMTAGGSSGGPSININASGITLPTNAPTPMVFVINYDKKNFFAGNQSIPLVDVRGAPTAITVLADGTFSANVTWSSPVKGNYTIVLDVDGDSVYKKSSGDIVNADNEIDFIVDSGTSHSQLTTLDDNGRSREVFNENSALHVYGLAKNLTPGAEVDVYVVASKLLPSTFVDWATARGQGTLDLLSAAVPVNKAHGPLLIPSLTKADKVATATVGPDGTLFLSAWRSPYKLLNMRALAAVPAVPDYKAEYDNDVEDPCADAAASSDQNFQAVCNVGSVFTDTYGTRFNLVIDVNRNGRFDGGDLVDTHDIGDISTYFGQPGQSVLDAGANGNPAVGEYKEYLNAKLSLDPPLSADNTYDDSTAGASTRYLCAAGLTKTAFESIVRPGSQVGFKVLNQEDYGSLRVAGSGLYNFIDANYDHLEVPANAQVCMAGEELELGSGSIGANASVTARASGSINLRGELRADSGGGYCFLAAEGLVLSAGTAVLSYFTGGAALPLLTLEIGVTVESGRQCFS